jgi:hypothetical protein
MANQIRFTNTKINVDKSPDLKQDADGYYTMIVGGLNIANGAGDYYTAAGAKDLFTKSSSFMRRVGGGYLKGELGHPQFTPGMATQDFINRCMMIVEENICVHYKDIWLDFDRVKENNGNPVIAIVAKLRPTGNKADALERSLTNPSENTAFSLRGFTDDARQPDGRLVRTIKSIVTYDFVAEPGLSIASKHDGIKNGIGMESLTDKIISVEAIKDMVAAGAIEGVSTESIYLAKELLSQISGGYQLKHNLSAKFTRW